MTLLSHSLPMTFLSARQVTLLHTMCHRNMWRVLYSHWPMQKESWWGMYVFAWVYDCQGNSVGFTSSTLFFAPFGCRFAPNWVWSEPSPIQCPLSPFGGPSFLHLTWFLCSLCVVHICAHLCAVWGWSLVCPSILGSGASAAYVIRGSGMQAESPKLYSQ
jgi:hypothetical protein